MQLDFHFKTQNVSIDLELTKGEWLVQQLVKMTSNTDKLITLYELKMSYEEQFEDFELFWFQSLYYNCDK